MRTVDADYLKEHTKHYKDCDGYNPVWEIIDNAPTVVIDEWISVDATLPKYTGLYLVSIDSLVTVANFDGTVFRSKGTSAPMGVDAWQPLPKSYKEVEGDAE